jgi:NAD-dependent protein deacetylase/lipoamidase
MTAELTAGIAALAERMRAATRVTVLTGAGVSAASGIPTFRGAGGLWRTHQATDLATPQAFQRDRKLVWEFYDYRRKLVAEKEPNRAHEVLAAWSKRVPAFTLVTQNVDGLHERAETPDVIRLHGSLWEVGCWAQCQESPHRWEELRLDLGDLPPPCPHCGDSLRPGVVWFGEGLPEAGLRRALEATVCDLFLVVGTAAVVHPAAGLIGESKAQGSFVVEINPEATPATGSVDLALQGPAEEILDAVEALL